MLIDRDLTPAHPGDERRGEKHRGRIGIVLGAGGPVGHAYHAGVLRALEQVLGWDTRHADLILGTSAGAQVGALLRAGLHGEDLTARVTGEPLRPFAAAIAQHYLRPSTTTAERWRAVPAAPGYLARSLRMPTLLRPGRLVAAILPAGRVSLSPLSDGFREVFGDSWPGPCLWVSAVNLDTGDAVIFGKPGSPSIDVGTAVASSAAVPGVFAPVIWQGVRYVDGGVASALHLNALAAEKLDLVVVISPLSVFAPMRPLVRREVRALSNTTAVALIEPTGEAAQAMGYQPMDVRRAPRVARLAYETTLRQIEEGPLRERFRDAF